MKAAQASSLVLVIVIIFCLSAVPAKAAAPTLADQLNMTLSTVDWSSPTSFIIPHFGLIFADQGNYDAALSTISDFKTLIQMKRIAELDGVNSSLLNQRVAEAMNNQQMNGHWPTVDPHGMQVYWKFLVFTYKYANELGLDTSKWSRDAAFQEYLNCWETDHDFLWFNATDGTPTDYSDRYYDENAEVLSIFLKFYQIGIPEALNYANQMWTHLYTSHWSGSYFPYTPSWNQTECEAGPFAEAIAELYVANNHNLPNFPDYILQDLDYKFISGGNWSAKLWSPGAYVVRHAESNLEKRLENTVTAWAAMHSYYPLMNDSMKSNFINLLTGSPNAWQGLIDNSSMYSEGRFRWRETSGFTDDATCGGAMILFLNGIVPDSGSLAIPVIDEVYQDWYSMFPASHFRFDYESQAIRIPVWAGKINFIFGTQNASYNFPEDGIYEVHFSSDWNTVTNATKVSSLSESFSYLNPHADDTPPPSPPPDTTSPIITVSSPQNETYSATDIFLEFTVNEIVSRPSYSIDGKANVTIYGNSVVLPPLPDGAHSIVVYASDLAGNTGSSGIIHFTVDTHPPEISLLSPQDQLYSTADIPLTFTVNERVPWIAYSVDEQTNVTISGNQTLKIADGSHSITVYARDLAGNIGSSSTVYFTTDTTPPSISLLSPENKTYDTTEIQLSFRVNETTSWMGYSLDGQAKVTITENTTLTNLSIDSHNLILYARDMAGNTEASEAVTFTIAPPPEPFPIAMTAALIAMIVAAGAAFRIYFKISHKAAKNLATTKVKSDPS
jgi:hypothetical protein